MEQFARQDGGCQTAGSLLDAYTSGELGDEESARVRRHLDACPACAADFDAAARLRLRVRRAVRGETAPEDLRERIKEFIRQS